MKFQFHKRSFMLLLSVVMIISSVVLGVVAYILATSGALENLFTPAYVTCEVVGTNSNPLNDNVTDGHIENVSVQNTGNIDAYIKTKVVVVWKNEDRDLHASSPVENTDYKIEYATDVAWQKGSDGFYYFLNSVAPDEYTDVLITSCVQLDSAQVPDGYYLSVEVIASAVQTKYPKAVDQWSNYKASVDSEGKLVVQ